MDQSISGLIWYLLFGSVLQDLNVDDFPPFQKLYMGEEMVRLGQDKKLVLDAIGKARDRLPAVDPDQQALSSIFADLSSFTERHWSWPESEEIQESVKQLINFTVKWQEAHVAALQEIEAIKARHTGNEQVALQAAAFVLQDFINDLQLLLDRCYQVERGENIKATGPIFDLFRQISQGKEDFAITSEFHRLMDSHPLTAKVKKE